MINQTLKFTVITVCYNAGHLLKKTIDSVIEQSYGPVEYIIVDGDSKDNTKEIIHSYKSGINTFISEPDSGLFEAMNKGIQSATGELVIFLNAGDYFVTRDVLKFYTSKMKFDEADMFFGRIVWNDPRTNDIFLSDHSQSVYSWHLKNNNFPHPATVYKRKLFDSIGLFDLAYTIAADYEWNVRALILHQLPFQYIDVIVSVFYADGISNNPAFAANHRKQIDTINEKYYKHGEMDEKFQETSLSFLGYYKKKKKAAKRFEYLLKRVY